MTGTSAQRLQTDTRSSWQPRHILMLHASTDRRQQTGTRRVAVLAHRAHPQQEAEPTGSAQAAHALTALAGAHTSDLPRPSQRTGSEARYVRRWLAPRLPELCEAVLRSALGGDMEAARLLLRMGGLDGKAESAGKQKLTKTGPGFAKKALDQFRAR